MCVSCVFCVSALYVLKSVVLHMFHLVCLSLVLLSMY